MHAFLLVGRNQDVLDQKIIDLQKSLGFARFEYILDSITSARELKKITNIATNERLGIVIKNIHMASPEALNALLKTIEEPPENYIFIFTAPNTQSVLETIVSRCRVIRVFAIIDNDFSDIQNFLELNLGKKFDYTDSLSDRQEAIAFCVKLIEYFHKLLLDAKSDKKLLVKLITAAEYSHKSISANGNITLNLGLLTISIHDIMGIGGHKFKL